MAIALKQLTPASAIHPGSMLLDEIKERGISQKELAGLTGIQQTQLNEIIKGKRGIHAEHALLIGKALQMEPSIWMNLQANYELDLARIKEKNQQRLAAIDLWQAFSEWVPVSFFKKHHLLKGDPVYDVEHIRQMYGIGTIDQLVGLFSQPAFAFYRKSQKLSVEKVALMGWMKWVTFEASTQKVAPLAPEACGQLIAELKGIFAANKHTVRQTQSVLAEFGIKLAIVPHPPKCAIDGLALWPDASPVIGLSLRHKRIDNFAYNIMHELGHIYLHLANNKSNTFIDIDEDGYGKSKEEAEAHAFARQHLIDQHAWERFMHAGEKTDAGFTRFARQQKVHPAIVLGRYCHETGRYNRQTNIARELL